MSNLTTLVSSIQDFSAIVHNNYESNTYLGHADEIDASYAVDVVAEHVLSNMHLVDVTMRSGSAVYDVVEDSKAAFEEVFLYGRTATEKAMARRQWGAVYALVISPMLDNLTTFAQNGTMDSITNAVTELSAITKALLIASDTKRTPSEVNVIKSRVRAFYD